MLTPFPPPYGGIAHWSVLMRGWVAAQSDESVSFFDSSLRGRAELQKRGLRRVVRIAYQAFALLVRMMIAVASRDIGVVHCCSSAGNGLARDVLVGVTCRLLSRRFVLHLHFGRVREVVGGHGLLPHMLRVAIRLCHAVVVLDKNSLFSIQEMFPKKEALLIPNALDASAFRDVEKTKLVVFSGWVIREKGVEELLCAWNAIDHCNWRLVFAGRYDNAYLEQLRDRFPMQDVGFLGEIPNGEMVDLLLKAEVMCLPSHTEGFPFAVLEAMFSRCAIVATEVGAIPEMLGKEAGLIVPVGNSKALAESLQRLMQDESLCVRLGGAARTSAVDRYSLRAIWPAYQKVWRVFYPS